MEQNLHRTQILLHPGQHKTLTEMARLERRSLSDLVRGIVQQEIERRAEAAEEARRHRLAALEQIAQHQAAILERRGDSPLDTDMATLLRDTREERDDEVLGRILQHRR